MTTTRRLAVLLIVFLAWTPAAYAWSWPVQGPVLQPFAYDESHPYAAGQHRGIDIGADAAGETVIAPAGGTVSFAGYVPTNGKSVTIETADGYSVTLTHLGSIAVAKGQTVAEHDPVGTIGPSGTPEQAGPYVHLGIRVTSDPNGYVDPLSLLPPLAAPSDGTDAGSSVSHPKTSARSKARPARPAPAGPRPAVTRGAAAPQSGTASAGTQQRAAEPRIETRPQPSSRPRVQRPQSSPRRSRPVVETAASHQRADLDAGHEIRPSASAAEPRPEPSSSLLGLLCNGAAALIALGAALAAHRRRRRSNRNAQVLRLPPPRVAEHRRFSRAA